ncbi:MAG: hypothetical protein EAZ85_14240 [Bacteroidetes bacterium]|nr:MAG: hypothetical protein EAZ85_14240 [Bacteroidota bacterium]TAG85290.1 MAG: hypothetical protein EAZ20_15595 [Bacteroidota bacterium]
MKYLLLDLFFLFSFSVFAQEIQVLSKKTQKPIPSAVVTYIVNDSITSAIYTNEEGKATLSFEKEVNFIGIVATGYELLEIPITDITPKIFIDDDVTMLSEVIITSDKKSTKKLGYLSKNLSLLKILTSGYEMSTLIKNPFEIEKKVKSVIIRLKRWKRLNAIFRVVFYTNKNNKPHEIYPAQTKNNIFILKPSKQISHELDLTNWGIVLPKEGLFVGIEYMGIISEERKDTISKHIDEKYLPEEIEITIPYIKTKNISYSYSRLKFSKYEKGQNSQEWWDYNDSWRFFDKKQKDTYYSPAVGIEVYE